MVCVSKFLSEWFLSEWSAYIHTYVRTSIPTYPYLHTYILAYLSTYLHANMPTYLRAHLPTYLHTYIPTYLHTYTHTYMPHCYSPAYLHTYTPTYLYSYTSTYLHTNIPAYPRTYIPTLLPTHIPTQTHRRRNTKQAGFDQLKHLSANGSGEGFVPLWRTKQKTAPTPQAQLPWVCGTSGVVVPTPQTHLQLNAPFGYFFLWGRPDVGMGQN